MKFNPVVAALVALLYHSLAWSAKADSIQYDFLTTSSIVIDNGPAVSVNNVILSLVVDWTAIDQSGPITTASGHLVSIAAVIPANATGTLTALLGDNTPSNLGSPFATLGFGTTLVSDVETDLSSFGNMPFPFVNQIAATDPFGATPIFTGFDLVNGLASTEDLDTLSFFDRGYSFSLALDGSLGLYGFTENVVNSSFSLLFGGASHSASIHYDIGQLINPVPPSHPVPEPEVEVLVGLGLIALVVRQTFLERSMRLRERAMTRTSWI